jgi:exopolyphosphatase
MSLRPENLLAFRLSSIPLTSLLHLEDLPVPSSELASAGLHFALVDSNRLLPKFGEGHVDMIIDHHADEGAHKDAPVRSIQVPTGSCASLVTKHFMEQWEASLSGPAGAAGSPIPKELATLLLAAILIDTGGLKKGGKATPVDYDSAAFLYPLSVWGEGQVSAVSFNTALPPSLVAAAKQLQESKFTVSTLTTHDLLIRDYKEFVLPTSSTSFPSLRVGLSTVPLGLKEWLKKEGDGWKSYLKIVDAYMVERELDVAGILTTFKKHKEHRRELLIIIRIGGSIQTRAVAEGVFGNLVGGLEKENVLSLAPWEGKGFRRFLSKRRTYEGLDGKNRLGKAWVQVNAEATRKQVAPILVSPDVLMLGRRANDSSVT